MFWVGPESSGCAGENLEMQDVGSRSSVGYGIEKKHGSVGNLVSWCSPRKCLGLFGVPKSSIIPWRC